MKGCLGWLKSQWRMILRNSEAHRRGWESLGRMYGYGDNWDDGRWKREISRSNRLYRLAHGKSPWHPVGGF